ncbi:MAG: hypothetical protein ACREJD_09420 [Phycisphaerales bacterium]
MSLLVINANGLPIPLKTTTDGGEEVSHHLIDGTVAVTKSGDWSLEAGSNEIGAIASITEGAVPGEGIRIAGAKVTVKRQKAAIAASTTDGAVIAAVATKVLRVVAAMIMNGGSGTTITFNSKGAGAGVAISQAFTLAANQFVIIPKLEDGWFSSVAGEGITATTSAGATVNITLVYVEEP